MCDSYNARGALLRASFYEDKIRIDLGYGRRYSKHWFLGSNNGREMEKLKIITDTISRVELRQMAAGMFGDFVMGLVMQRVTA